MNMRVSEILDGVGKRAVFHHVEELRAIERLRTAHKFMISLSQEAANTALDYAEQMLKFGVFVLPFDNCYFEFKDGGALCWKEDNKFIGRLYLAVPDGGHTGGISFDIASYFRDPAKCLLYDQH